MNTTQVLSPLPRRLLWITAAAFALVGLVLFIAPEWSAANFSWKVSPLVVKTIGGWCLGSAAMAGLAAYHRRWNVIHTTALYVGVFSLTEASVLVIHAAKLKLDALLAWPYLGMLALAVVTSASVLVDWLRQRPTLMDEGRPAPAWVRGIIFLFIPAVFFLAGVAFSGHWVGLNGGIFPEPLSPFTLNSFGAFYFSLAFSTLTLLRVRHLAAITVHVWGGLALIVFITAAALADLPAFNFAAHPFQSIYLGAYLLALILALVYLWSERARPGSPAGE